MLRPLFFSALLFLAFCGRAQDTLLVYYDTAFHQVAGANEPNRGILVREGSNWSADVFRLLDGAHLMSGYYLADHITPDGPFTYYFQDGSVRSRGYFHEGRHEGGWREWDSLGRLTDSFYFENDTLRANTVWSYGADNELASLFFNDNRTAHRVMVQYTPGGHPYSRNEWTNGVKENFVYWDNDSLATYERIGPSGHSEGKAFFSPEGRRINLAEYNRLMTAVSAHFPGGNAAFQHYIEESMRRKLTNKSGGSVHVIIHFTLDENGRAIDITVNEPVHPLYRQAAIEVLKEMPNWEMKGHHRWGPITYSFLFNL